MTDKREQEIINEIIPNGERITGTEFITRLMDKAAEVYETDEAKAQEYINVMGAFLDKFPEAVKKWREELPPPEEFSRRLDSKCATCEIGEWAEQDDGAAVAVCKRCKELLEQLKAEYSKTRSKMAQDGQGAALGVSPTSAEKRQDNGKDKPAGANKHNRSGHMENIELFNVRDGAAYISTEERKAHPDAEYFTAEIDKKYVGEVLTGWEPDEVKSVLLTFRKIITVKNGTLADVTKSGEEIQFAAGKRNGKAVLLVGGQNDFETELVGVGVRVVISFIE